VTEKEVDKQIAKILRALADEKDPPINQGSQPSKADSNKAAQEAHEAELASFNTQKKGGTRQSLNSAATKAEIEALLEQIKRKKQ
jgi:hypothetical protein